MSSYSRQEWITSAINDDIVKDKKRLQASYIWYMLNRTQSLFKYNGLPDTIPQKDLEILLQVNGNAVIAQVDGELYAFRAGLGGVPNPYYLPTIAVIANPALKYNATLEIDKECVVIKNDSTYTGLVPMFQKYSALLADTDITLRFSAINARTPALISADSDNTKKSAELYLSDIEEGKKLGVIATDKFFEGLQVSPYSSSMSNIKDSIELQQYLKASWYNELGLNANYNMKRESINDAEAGMNEEILLPLIDDMLHNRELGLEQVNSMFGTNITVELNSSWKIKREEIEYTLDSLEQEAEQPTEESTIEVETEEETKDEETDRNDNA